MNLFNWVFAQEFVGEQNYWVTGTKLCWLQIDFRAVNIFLQLQWANQIAAFDWNYSTGCTVLPLAQGWGNFLARKSVCEAAVMRITQFATKCNRWVMQVAMSTWPSSMGSQSPRWSRGSGNGGPGNSRYAWPLVSGRATWQRLFVETCPASDSFNFQMLPTHALLCANWTTLTASYLAGTVSQCLQRDR